MQPARMALRNHPDAFIPPCHRRHRPSVLDDLMEMSRRDSASPASFPPVCEIARAAIAQAA